LHYGANNQDFEDRQLMVLDAGSEFECYASDVTRTFPLNGAFTPEANEVYSIVEEMQEVCISMIKPGASWSTITSKAQLVALEGLKRLGILRSGPLGQPPFIRTVRAFFMHGLGHLVGLDTHDVIQGVHIHNMLGGKAWSLDKLDSPVAALYKVGSSGAGCEGGGDRSSPPLEKDMVVTCEPGLYFNQAYVEWYLGHNPDLIPFVDKTVLERYYPVCGCRIEDCILVTEDGYENLTTAPKGKEMLRVINGK
jgi:Xaa-Pro dipeptidase